MHFNYENRLFDWQDNLPKFKTFPSSPRLNNDGTVQQVPPAPGITSLVLHRQGAPNATMPVVGLGTWQAAPGEVGNAVVEALKAGYRHLDCAACYGNEKEIGAALRKAFDEGLVRREDLFITSKLWNSEHAAEDVQPALTMTLEDLGLDYLDLYLIHWPQAFKHVDGTNRSFPRNDDGSMIYDLKSTHEETWKALEVRSL